MADSRNIRRTGGDEEKEVASGREEGGTAVGSKRGKERQRESEREVRLEIVSASVWPLAYWN